MGIGDAISKLTSVVGVRPCEGCKRRAEKLNSLFKLPVSVQSIPISTNESLIESCGSARLVQRGTSYTVFKDNYSHTFCCGDLVNARKELARLCH